MKCIGAGLASQRGPVCASHSFPAKEKSARKVRPPPSERPGSAKGVLRTTKVRVNQQHEATLRTLTPHQRRHIRVQSEACCDGNNPWPA
eukprot:1093483-Rhodomonas_salina.1